MVSVAATPCRLRCWASAHAGRGVRGPGGTGFHRRLWQNGLRCPWNKVRVHSPSNRKTRKCANEKQELEKQSGKEKTPACLFVFLCVCCSQFKKKNKLQLTRVKKKKKKKTKKTLGKKAEKPQLGLRRRNRTFRKKEKREREERKERGRGRRRGGGG